MVSPRLPFNINEENFDFDYEVELQTGTSMPESGVAVRSGTPILPLTEAEPSSGRTAGRGLGGRG